MRRCCFGFLILGLFALPLACMPDVGQDPVPAALEFDPTSTPARIPQPIALVINPETGKIDFSLVGTDVPEVCDGTGMPIANCEFMQYLESLDGFPTVLPATAPATDPIDLASIQVGQNLVVLDGALAKAIDPATLKLTFDSATTQLVIDSPTGWEPGVNYVFGIKGGPDGVKAEGGLDVVGGPILYLLKKEESLLCGADSPKTIAADCPYYGLLQEMGLSDVDIRTSLVALEEIRQALNASGMWQLLADVGGMAKADAAVAWSFPTHTASVIQLDPSKPLLPNVVSPKEVRLGFKGTIDAETVTLFKMGKPGSLFLLDLTALDSGDLVNGIPKATVAVQGQDIVITLEADFPEGHTLGLLATTGITNADAVPFVPSPVTVLLKATGELVDDKGKSNVSDISDADAGALEAGRKDLAILLDDDLFATLTGLTRADLVYVYAFDFPNP